MIKMKIFELFETMDDDIPISREALEDELPLYDYVEIIRDIISNKTYKSITIDPRKLVLQGKLLGTQSNTDHNDPQDSAVFPDLELPVIFEASGIGYIIDGHHRLKKAYENYQKIKVFWFTE
jgi:hypothetical protein